MEMARARFEDVTECELQHGQLKTSVAEDDQERRGEGQF